MLARPRPLLGQFDRREGALRREDARQSVALPLPGVTGPRCLAVDLRGVRLIPAFPFGGAVARLHRFRAYILELFVLRRLPVVCVLPPHR